MYPDAYFLWSVKENNAILITIGQLINKAQFI